jgi:hypothetical protein
LFKKFNTNLNYSNVGKVWFISLATLSACLFELVMPGEGIVPKTELIIILLSFATIFNLVTATYILIKGEFKQVNVTYVCPTARQYMSEQEIVEIEKE